MDQKNIYITSDTHFNHQKILNFSSRPSNYEDMLHRSFMNIKKDDTLIHLGDIAIGDIKQAHEKFIQPIKGRKILVKGNHDKKSNSWYLNHGWDFVCRTFFDKYFGVNILFSHKPTYWDGIFDVNIHGHLHELKHREDVKTYQYNYLISLEFLGYDLILLRDVLNDWNNYLRGRYFEN